jgi:hypothetical protein
MMKLFYLLIIATVISSSITFGHALAQETGNLVFFMKANSTANFYAEFTFPRPSGSLALSPNVYPYPEINGGGVPVNTIPVMVEPKSLVASQHNINVTYTITTKNNIKGIYEIDAGTCARFYPLVVGLNESEVDPAIFHSFYHRGFFCESMNTLPPMINITGYSGMTIRTFSENSSTWGTYPQPSTTTVPEFPFAYTVLAISMITLVIFYRIRPIKI